MKIYNNITNTYPVLVHNNGHVENKLYQSINWPVSCSDLEDCTVLTWNNTNSPGDFEKSLIRSHIPFRVLAKNVEKWNNIDKPKYVLKENIKSKYIICADSFDVKVTGDLAKCIERLKQTGCRAIYASENNFSPIDLSLCDTIKWYRSNFGPRRFLNGGMMVAETEFAVKLFKRFEELKERIITVYEQRILHEIIVEFYPDMIIDSNCNIFQCLFNTKPGEIICLN